MNNINPFLKGGYAKNNDFVGRKNELQRLRKLINSGAGGISIVGQQRIGKTSVAKQIQTDYQHSVWLDLGEKESPAAMFNELTDEVLKLFPEQKQELREYIDTNTSVLSDDTSAYRRFRSLLEIIPKENGIVIFLDEFDAIRTFDKQGKVPQRLRTLMDNCGEYHICIVLISRRTVFALEESLSHCSTLDGQCTKLFIKPFQPDEAELMTAKLKCRLDESLQRDLDDFAGGHPYLLKKALADLWESSAIGEQSKAELLAYFEKLRGLLQEDKLWTTLVQEVMWNFHDIKNAESFSRLESYGLLSERQHSHHSWSTSLDMYIGQNIKDASLNEPWAQTEIKFRQFVALILQQKFGTDWELEIRKTVKIDKIFLVSETLRTRTLKTLKIASDNLLDYTYTWDLWEIVSLYWKNFEPYFGQNNHNKWQEKIHFIGQLRNVIAHNNSINLRDDQIREFYDIVGELDNVFSKIDKN